MKRITRESLLAETGRLLYGSRWKADLALAIGVTDRTVAYWEKKAPKPEHPVWAALDRIVSLRRASLATLQDRLQ